MSAFRKAFRIVIGHEGGLSRDPDDHGNWTGGTKGVGALKGTKYGISAASYPHLDIANLTLDQAEEIYRDDYWRWIRGDDLPPVFALVTFDAAVNAGVRNASRWLQMALVNAGKQIWIDGIIGPKTIAAANAVQPDEVLVEMLAQRNEHNRRARSADVHGLGWSRRLFRLAFQTEDFRG